MAAVRDVTVLKDPCRAGKVAQWLKVPAAKSDSPQGGRRDLTTLVLQTHILMHAHSAHACTHRERGYNVRIKFVNLKDSSMFRERQNQKTENCISGV